MVLGAGSGRPSLAGRWLGVGSGGRHLLQLRLDVDPGGLGIVSGDLYEGEGLEDVHDPDDPTAHGARCRYECSFLSRLVTESWGTARALELTAPLTFLSRTDLHGQLLVRIWVPLPGRPELRAEARLTVASHRHPGAAVVVHAPLGRRSRLFRQARLLLDSTVDKTTGKGYALPASHRTSSVRPCPDDVPARDLSIAGAYADAGIELRVTQGASPVPLPALAYTNGLTDDELHAILSNVSAREPAAGWWVHMLVAPRHTMRGILGMVYDTERLHPRHGSVVFFDELRGWAGAGKPIGDDDPRLAREWLYTTVHEIGHAFNLLHSFQKGYFGGSDVEARPASPSWMNYPHLYPYGRMRERDQPERFWGDFRFAFDREELEHLRHHERDEVMMGGDTFGSLGDLAHPDALGCAGGLAAWLEVDAAYELGEEFPVTLAVANRSGKPIMWQHPRDLIDVIDLTVRDPGGHYRRFEPLMTRLETSAATQRVVMARGATHRVRFTPFYGRRGFTFGEPGTYVLHAALRTRGRPAITLPTTSLLIRSGGAVLERLVADRLFGDEQGHFLTFCGGDHLTRGRGALEDLVGDARFAHTRAAIPVKVALGASRARSWQGPHPRPPQPAEAMRFVGDLAPHGLLDGKDAAGPAGSLRVLLETLKVLDVPAQVMQRIEPEVLGLCREASKEKQRP